MADTSKQKTFVSDLKDMGYDFDKEYYLSGKKYYLRDLPEDALVRFRKDGHIDKRTFLPLVPGYGEGTAGRPEGSGKMQNAVNIDDPKKLRKMFQQCFTVREVNSLINKAKEVAIKNGNQKMIQFLLEQLFGKAPQYVTHAGDEDKPLINKEVKEMSETELDEYLNQVIEADVYEEK